MACLLRRDTQVENGSYTVSNCLDNKLRPQLVDNIVSLVKNW